MTIDAVVNLVRTDAARRLGKPIGDTRGEGFKVVSAEAVTWSDGSLGCPKADTLYTQALVEGFQIKLLVKGEVWDYHANRRGTLVLCPAGSGTAPVPGSPLREPK